MIEKHEGCSWDVDNVLIFDLDAGYTNVFDLQKKKKSNIYFCGYSLILEKNLRIFKSSYFEFIGLDKTDSHF